MTCIAGVDEAGRGPLAGPVVAAAVVLGSRCAIDGLADSKTIPHKRRVELSLQIRSHAVAWCIGVASVDEIENLNILYATLLAMRRAVLGLPRQPNLILVDGQHPPEVPCAVKPIIRGDSKVREISAASILAKVYRDQEMIRLDHRYPGYGFAVNKGYPTMRHLAALRTLGPTAVHRKHFRGVRNVAKDK